MITYFDDHCTITPQFFNKVEKICEKYIVREVARLQITGYCHFGKGT